MNKLVTTLVTAPFAILALAACAADTPAAPEMELAGPAFSVASSPLSITANWATGGVSRQGEAAHSAQTNTVRVQNDFAGPGIFRFARWNQGNSNNFGRPVSAAVNGGTIFHAFAYKGANWVSTVPFAFGTRPSGAEAIWTPGFTNAAPRPVAMGEFVTDNAPGDLDPATDVIDLGNFKAQGIISGAGIPRVEIYEKIGGNWVRVARTDGPQGRCELLAFTVVDVRSAYTVSGGKVSAPVLKTIPVLKARNTTSNKMELWTNPLIPQGINTGASKMYVFP